MEVRELGKTNIFINRVGLGGIPIQRVNQLKVNDLIDYLMNNNVNFIDTARGYTCSEEYLGNSLKGKREKFFIATKSMSRSYDDMKNDIELSLEKLQTTYIDLYQLHNLKSDEEYKIVMGPNGAYKALLEAKEKGLIKHIGITSHSYDFLYKIIDTHLFETIQFPYNIVEDRSKYLFRKAKELGIGTICMKPLAGGAIENGLVAIKYLLNDENVDVVIPGMAEIAEAKVNLSAEKGAYTPEEEIYIKNIKEKLNDNFCRRCGYCAPCAKGIDIPNCFVFYGYHERYDLKEWAISRYNSLKTHAGDCIECGLCKAKCPYGIDIPNELKKVKKVFGK